MHKLEARTTRAVPAGALMALGFVLLHGTAAAALPPAGVVGSVSFNILSPPPIDVGDFGSFPLDASFGALRLDVGATPSPSISAGAEIAPFFFGRANATLQYSVLVSGPEPTARVRVAVAGGVAGSSSLGGVPGDGFHGFALKAQWRLDHPTLGTVFSEGIATPALQGSFSEAFDHEVLIDMAVDTIYRVTMSADAAARSGTAFAFIDPVFSFADPRGEGWALAFSQGIGNAPIPEPAPAALLAVGLLALCRVRRPSRRA